MWLLLFISAVILSKSDGDDIMIKTATTDPLHPVLNGVTTNMLSDVLLTPYSWFIDVKTEFNFQLHLGINGSFGFHPHTKSKLQISINSNVSMPTQQLSPLAMDRDILFSFVVNDQYFTTMLRMDNTGNNWIYPLCDTNIPPSTPMMSDIDDHLYEILSFSNTSTNDYVDMEPIGQNVNAFPIIFTLTNDPIHDYVLFEYSNPSMSTSQHQKCGFSPSFATESGLNLYIAGSDYGVSFDISSFDVSYSYNSSYAISDTTTTIATFEATIAPTIKEENMIQNETQNDDEKTSIFPTISPTITTIVWNENDERNENVVDANSSNDGFIYALIASCSFVCILFVFCLFIASKKWLNDNYRKRMRVNTTDNVRDADALSMQITGAIEYNNYKVNDQYKDEQSSDPNEAVEVHTTKMRETSDAMSGNTDCLLTVTKSYMDRESPTFSSSSDEADEEDESLNTNNFIGEYKDTNMCKLGAVISIDLD